MGAVAAGLAVAAVGAGVGAYGASQAGKGSGQSRSLGEIGQMPVGLYGDQLQRMADIQFDLNRKQAQLSMELYPQFAGKEREAQLRSAKAMLSLYPEMAAYERSVTAKQRERDLKDLTKLGPQYQALYEQLSPGYAALDSMVEEAGSDSPLLGSLNARALGDGRSPLRDKLESAALYDLNLDRDLSPEELRDALLASRTAWGDRGLAMSNPAMISEVMGRDSLARQRQAQRRAFAGGVWQMGSTEDANFRNFGINVEGANQASKGNRLNAILTAGQAKLSPILSAMTRTGVSPSAGGAGMQLATSSMVPAQIMSTAPQITQAAQTLSPLYNYSADVFDTNFNAAEARALNKANAYSAIGAGLMGAGSNVAGSGMKTGGM